jgi:GntR family transcriptional regulator/MocR family aminotransferase
MARATAILGVLALDRRRNAALHQQLYDGLREAILLGRLAPATRLPPTRMLARELGTARNTVVAAFERLIAEGYLQARVGDGTRVAALPPEALLHVRRVRHPALPRGRAPRLSRRGRALTSVRRPAPDAQRRAFQPGLPEFDELPLDTWARLLARRARTATRNSLGYAHGTGLPALREAIAAYLGPARGVACDPAQIIVVAGAQAGLDLMARLLLDPDDAVWVEEPGYLGARGAFTGAGVRLVPVPVDGDGLDVAAGTRACPAARLAYVTPSHQYPLGVTMSLARRLALLDWAARAGAWILEDDYDSEYRYSGRPVAAMQGIDPSGRVVYLGTFSKTLFPALRTGYLVVPPALIDACTAAIRQTGHTVPAAVQAALADFLAEGHLAAHIRRMRALYGARQQRLLAQLARRLAGALEARSAEAGMQIAARLLVDVDDAALSTAALANGVIAPPLSLYHLGPVLHRGLLLGYAGVPEREIDRGVEQIARAVESVRRDRGRPARS